VSLLFKSFMGSFMWSLFQWFYTAENGCGFGAFPTFGMEAYQRLLTRSSIGGTSGGRRERNSPLARVVPSPGGAAAPHLFLRYSLFSSFLSLSHSGTLLGRSP
jgi:hypothetical protein